MDNKPKEDKLMVITLDNSNPKSKIYWKEEDYNIFRYAYFRNRRKS